MPEASDHTLTITTKNNTTRKSRHSTYPQPKKGDTWLYESYDGTMNWSEVKAGTHIWLGAAPIPQKSWIEFDFSGLPEPKKIFEGGGILAYHGSDGLHYHGSSSGLPSDDMYASDEDEEVGEGTTRAGDNGTSEGG